MQILWTRRLPLWRCLRYYCSIAVVIGTSTDARASPVDVASTEYAFLIFHSHMFFVVRSLLLVHPLPPSYTAHATRTHYVHTPHSFRRLPLTFFRPYAPRAHPQAPSIDIDTAADVSSTSAAAAHMKTAATTTHAARTILYRRRPTRFFRRRCTRVIILCAEHNIIIRAIASAWCNNIIITAQYILYSKSEILIIIAPFRQANACISTNRNLCDFKILIYELDKIILSIYCNTVQIAE